MPIMSFILVLASPGDIDDENEDHGAAYGRGNAAE